MTDEEALKRWPETMAGCPKCFLIHESFIACPSTRELNCEICRNKGGWEWNRYAEPPCWEPAECPDCGAEPQPGMEPPKEGICAHLSYEDRANGGRYCLTCMECIA